MTEQKPKPKLYIDSCCIISLATYQFTGKREAGYEENDNYYLVKILEAGKNGDMLLYTSSLTVVECQHINGLDNAEVQRLFNSILLSGRLFIHISADVFIAIRARELRWTDGIKGIGPTDGIHLASAIKMGCKEFLTLDGTRRGLLQKAESIKKKGGISVIKPSQTLCLPDEYLQEEIPLDEKAAKKETTTNRGS